MYVHAIIFMLGMAFTMEMDEHVGGSSFINGTARVRPG